MAGRLDELIHSATNSPAMAVKEPLLKAIKSSVRSSDNNVKLATELLMDRLGKNHAQVRYLALLIVDELFTRSKLFRNHLVAVFDKFLVLCVGHRADHPLPPPSDRAALLKSKALEFVEKWNDMFGPHYKQLRLGYDYLKNTLSLNFPGVREAATRAQEERDARERRTQELLRCRLAQLSENFTELKREIESGLDQMEECFTILQDVTGDDDGELFTDGEEETEVYGIKSLRDARDHEDEAVPEECRDNTAVFDMLRDLLKLVSTRHVPAMQEWLSVLMRVDPEDRQRRDSLMKEVIDLRNRVSMLTGRCEEFGIKFVHRARGGEDDDDNIEWEDEQVYEPSMTDRPTRREKQDVGRQKESSRASASLSKTSGSSDLKEKLLQEAPVLTWGSFLDGWGSEAATPANTRGLFLDNHWGRVDPDVLIPSEKVAKLQVRASYYEPQKSDIRPCLAPLRNGGLCQRRDLRKCPLHGPVIPRDEHGNPLEKPVQDKGKRKASGSCSTERDLPTPEQLAALAVKNVRERDRAAQEQKLLRRSQAKRDREHNEAVLSSSAVAQSSLADEWSSLPAENISKRRKGGGGLSAMLHKKPTSKDRIAKKLLTGKATEATVATLARCEDIKYRESFPNQW